MSFYSLYCNFYLVRFGFIQAKISRKTKYVSKSHVEAVSPSFDRNYAGQISFSCVLNILNASWFVLGLSALTCSLWSSKRPRLMHDYFLIAFIERCYLVSLMHPLSRRCSCFLLPSGRRKTTIRFWKACLYFLIFVFLLSFTQEERHHFFKCVCSNKEELGKAHPSLIVTCLFTTLHYI